MTVDEGSTELSGTTAIVTGASRGFGRGIAGALVAAGVQVIGVARTPGPLRQTQDELGAGFTPYPADATEPGLAAELLARYRPRTVVLNAGAAPTLASLPEQTWETFGRNWQSDVRQAFEWTRAALLLPLAPGSVVLAMSSGAALRGSPLSGGYAGAKATVRFIGSYAAEESRRAGLGIRFLTVLPQLTPATDLGALAVAGYADRQGVDVSSFARNLEPVLTPDHVGKTVAGLVAAGPDHASYLLTGAAAPSELPL
jgi:NAD(P)-dependent dehydrogenase (short-subunit alcohol dehydrogenase family)